MPILEKENIIVDRSGKNFRKNFLLWAGTILFIFIGFWSLSGESFAATCSFQWSPNPPEENVLGYKLYYGTTSRNDVGFIQYDYVIDVGSVSSYVISDLEPETMYYFAITAYNAVEEGEWCDEVSYYTVDTTPVNASPTINSFTSTPSSLNNPGETTTFNVSATDPDGDSLTYTINFGDGTANGSGSQVVHTYETEGTYTAEVSVDDGNGHIVGESLQVTVNNVPPAKPTGVSVSSN